jgi:uncharacterized 2Fe-2S/4Fe-4S cluster protein (DUF4445 family)
MNMEDPMDKTADRLIPEQEPSAWVHQIELPEPSLSNNTADADRLIHALKTVLQTDAVDMDLHLLRRIPALLRSCDGKLRCACFKDHGRGMLLGVKGFDDPCFFAGIAIDLGTTRVVLRLIDLESGKTMDETAFDNPQASIGPDILSRIHHADRQNGLQELNRLILDGLNLAIERCCETAGISPADLFVAAVSGNTSMGHLFLGIPPGGIIREPYIPVVNRPGLIPAEAVGLKMNPHARVFIFPNVGSYFGGDLISGILYSGLHKQKKVSILVDVGTNAEVVVGNEDWLVACAGAAGPALEGGVSAIGMTAGPGVIDGITIDAHTRAFHIHTIDDLPPKGICGSGMIDLMAGLFLAGMVDIRGRLVPSACGNRLMEKEGMRRIVVVFPEESADGGELSISQADIDSLIRSKAAMYSILQTITEYVETGFERLSSFFVAGSFGCFINPRSAISIGMLPDLPEDRYKPLGNSSLEGATLALTSREAFDEIEEIRNRITYLELNVNQTFMGRFSAARFLPHTDPSLFPSVKRPV